MLELARRMRDVEVYAGCDYSDLLVADWEVGLRFSSHLGRCDAHRESIETCRRGKVDGARSVAAADRVDLVRVIGDDGVVLDDRRGQLSVRCVVGLCTVRERRCIAGEPG